MTVGELEVAVMDGETLVQHCACSCTTMPDGTSGMIWRGSPIGCYLATA